MHMSCLWFFLFDSIQFILSDVVGLFWVVSSGLFDLVCSVWFNTVCPVYLSCSVLFEFFCQITYMSCLVKDLSANPAWSARSVLFCLAYPV